MKPFSLLLTAIPLFALAATLHAKSPLPENTPVPDLTRSVVKDTSHTYHLGPTGARGWIHKIGSYASPDDFEGFFSTAQARQILVTSVEQGSPADGVLAPGDVILGSGEKPFTSDARRAIADAIDEAEREENGGKLQLLRWRPVNPDQADAATRGNGRTEPVTLTLRVMGSFSASAPYDCPKSATIAAETKRRILETGLKDRLHIAALGLLATGEADAIAAVREFIRGSRLASPDLKLSVDKPFPMASWDWSYAAVLLAEYHLLTGDKDVLPALEQYAVNLAKGQAICGGWGHKMADLGYNEGRANGRLTGYGTLNQPSLVCLMAMIFAEKCGIHHPEITRAIQRAGDFYGYHAGKGCIPYGHDRPLEYMLANNGMSGSAAIAFAQHGETQRAEFFARMSAAAHGKTEIGHTGPYFGAFWIPLGANVAGPETCAEFFKQHRWLQTLARKWNGGFVYQPPGGRWGGSSEKYYDLSSDGAYLMFYAAPRRQMLLTGKNADQNLWLKGDDAREAVHASLIEYAKVDDAKLLALLGHPIPSVRRMAADELGKRAGDFIPRLVAMLENGTPAARIGACHALGACGKDSPAAATALIKRIGDADADAWLRGRALNALRSTGPASKESAEALLRVAVADKPADPRGDLDMEIALTLGQLIQDPYALGIDPPLLHAAANKLLGHPHHAARTAIMRLLAMIPLEHLPAVADRIVEVIHNNNPGYQTYHHDGARAAGLAILERLAIRDGMGLAVATIETDKWGQQPRIYGPQGRLALIARFGADAQAVLPQLRAMRQDGKLNQAADPHLRAIAEATASRQLITLEQAKGTKQAAAEARPRLQIFNDSPQTIDLFWLKSDAERIPNGSVEPGKDTLITTSPGHRFLIVGRDDQRSAEVSSKVLHQAYRFDPTGKNGIPAFYTQVEWLRGFPIVASQRVNPFALKEAVFIGDKMLAKRPDVLEAMVLSGARLCIMAHDEFTTDLPEFKRMAGEPMPGFETFSGRDFWDARARGTGGSDTDPCCTCAEENLLGYPGDPYAKENILIHEFAHNIHLRGLNNVDATFDVRLKQAYAAAMKDGLWKGKYASVNHYEYFAEGVQSWFDDNRENDHDHNHVNTRAELIAYDPRLAEFCREVFADTEFKYTKPATRLHGHMAGYDPSTAPTFVWPERLAAVKAAIRTHAEARGKDPAKP